MEIAVISPTLDWTIFWVCAVVLVLACSALGTVYITREGHVDLFGNVTSLEGVIFAAVLFLAIMLVAAPFFGLWVLVRWLIHRFSPEARRAHEEAVRHRVGKRNVRLDQDRMERRLAASKQRAAKRTAAKPPGAP